MDINSPRKGERYTGCDSGIVYEWNGEKWIDTGERKEVPDWILEYLRSRK